MWLTSPDWPFEHGAVPLITFSDGGFYRSVAEEALASAGVDFTVVFSGPSIASVIAAVEAGLGIAVLPKSWAQGELGSWGRGERSMALPVSRKVARHAPGEPSTVANELLADIVGELTPSTEQ